MDTFHNRLRILRSIDRSEVSALSDPQWAAFREQPVAYFIRCSDEARAVIWDALVEREHPR